MRSDTPQLYEYITVENVKGAIKNFVDINPWTQYFDLKGRPDIPMSYGKNVTIRNCECECETFFNVKPNDEQFILSDFVLENLKIKAQNNGYEDYKVKNAQLKNVQIELVQAE